MTALPRSGYEGEIPEFPLPNASAREVAVWDESWRTPQAAAWASEPWRWRTVAQWVRWSVRIEDPEASAALGTVAMRLADQIGMTPAGLKENGWALASVDAVDEPDEPAPQPTSRSRFTVVPHAEVG